MADIAFSVTGTKRNRVPEFLSYYYESVIATPVFFFFFFFPTTYGWLQSQTELSSPTFSTSGLVNSLTVDSRSVEGCRWLGLLLQLVANSSGF